MNIIIASELILAAATLQPDTMSKTDKIESLSQISNEQPEGTLFLLDLDDTVFDSTTIVGSHAWRKYIIEAAGNAWHDKFTYTLAKLNPAVLTDDASTPLKRYLGPTEEETANYINRLQKKGYAVAALTARERRSWYDMEAEGSDQLTVDQLCSIGINFNNQSIEKNFPQLTDNSEYYKGIFFGDTSDENSVLATKMLKGPYLAKLLEKVRGNLPKKIIFVDDKASHANSVADSLRVRNISFESYVLTVKEKRNFDAKIANIQLLSFYESKGKTILSDKLASEVAERNPDKDAQFYLEEAKKLAALSHF